VTKEPHASPVPPDVPPIESFEPVPPADDTIPADAAPSSGAPHAEPGYGGRPSRGASPSGGAPNSGGAPTSGGAPGFGGATPFDGATPFGGASPFGSASPSGGASSGAGYGAASAGGGYGDPAHFETVPVATGAPKQSGKPVRVGRGTGKLSKRLITAYFAGGLALLLAGTVTVFYLAVKVYGGRLPDRTVTASRDYPTTPALPSTGGRGKPSKPAAPRAPAPDAFEPSSSPRARFGPERLANGKSHVIQGEGGSRFEVTVKAGKFRRSACDQYSVKPKEGGYLTTQLKVKVLEGEPDISEYAFPLPETGRRLAALGRRQRLRRQQLRRLRAPVVGGPHVLVDRGVRHPEHEGGHRLRLSTAGRGRVLEDRLTGQPMSVCRTYAMWCDVLQAIHPDGLPPPRALRAF